MTLHPYPCAPEDPLERRIFFARRNALIGLLDPDMAEERVKRDHAERGTHEVPTLPSKGKK